MAEQSEAKERVIKGRARKSRDRITSRCASTYLRRVQEAFLFKNRASLSAPLIRGPASTTISTTSLSTATPTKRRHFDSKYVHAYVVFVGNGAKVSGVTDFN